MTLRLDDNLMYRDKLDGVHGIHPVAASELADRFADVQAEVRHRREHGEYGFLKLGHQPGVVEAIEQWAMTQRRHFDHLIVLGIGGSALGPRPCSAPCGLRPGTSGRRSGVTAGRPLRCSTMSTR